MFVEVSDVFSEIYVLLFFIQLHVSQTLLSFVFYQFIKHETQ